MQVLAQWQNFYIIVGSAAGALVGLQFVVMTLIAQIPMTGREAEAGDAFGTPNVVHFSVVLLFSAMVCVPWRSTTIMAIIWALVGGAGAIYIGRIAARVRAQQVYKPVFEDWLYYILLPLTGYLVIIVAAAITRVDEYTSLFLAAITSLTLLFVGIHNAWDLVTYHIFSRKKYPDQPTQLP
jgi:hypothetical protein